MKASPPAAGGIFWGAERVGSITWVWVTLVAASLAYGGILWVEKRQDRLISHLTAEQTLLRQARVDLTKGYLHISLGGRPGSPFDLAQGLALLGQAHSSLEKALRLQREFERGPGARGAEEALRAQLAAFAREVARFRGLVAGGPAVMEADAAWITELRIAFFALERQAEQVDEQMRADLSSTTHRHYFYRATITGGAGILLAFICLIAFAGDRARKRAEKRRREAEATLRSRESMLRGILDATKESIFQFSGDGIILMANETAARRLGAPLEEVIGKHYSRFMTPELAQSRQIPLTEVLESGRPVEYEDERRGMKFDHSFYPILEADGRVSSIVAYSRDVTERKRAEERLRESEQKFKVMAETSPLAIYASSGIGQKGNYVNPTFLRLFGYTIDEVPTVDEWWPLAYPDETYRARVVTEWQRRVERAIKMKTGIEPMEVVVTCKDGSRKNVEWGFISTPNQNYAFGLDLTERKRAEEALLESEERLHLALDAAKAGTWDWDLRTNENFWSEELFRVYGLEPHSCEPSYESWRQTIHPEDREKAEQAVREAAGAGTELRAEWRVQSREGGERWLMSRGRPVFDEQGMVIRYLGAVIDITERKRAEIELYKSHQEKVALLKEVHHRVKNNLQIVVSLLGLQAGRINNPEALDILGDTRNRVYSMALLHETLYRSESFASIGFSSYIDRLTGQIVRSYGQYAARVKVEIRANEIGLPLDQAVPCGLIINELVSNALKHAFPGNRAGLVTVEFGRTDEHMLLLRVRDDGVGLPPGLDLAGTSTLGLNLVHGLARQLLGSVAVDRPAAGGTEFRVVFPEAPQGNL